MSVAYLAMVPEPGQPQIDGANWYALDVLEGEDLAFDHREILQLGIERARAKLEYTTLARSFCEETFTIVELREVYEAVWGCKLDPANFHRKVLASDGFVEVLDGEKKQGRGRPARLYRAGVAEVLQPAISRAAS